MQVKLNTSLGTPSFRAHVPLSYKKGEVQTPLNFGERVHTHPYGQLNEEVGTKLNVLA